MRARSKQGRLFGLRLTVDQVREVWSLAGRGFAAAADSSRLLHRQGDVSVRASNLDQLVKEAEEPPCLDNLMLVAEQGKPRRYVRLTIGPGWKSTVTVEADDHTWALGRYEELMEALTPRTHLLARAFEQHLRKGLGFAIAALIMIVVPVVGAVATMTLRLIMDLVHGHIDPAKYFRTAYPYGLVCAWAVLVGLGRWLWLSLRSGVRISPGRRYDLVQALCLATVLLTLIVAYLQLGWF